ncbi:probable phosphoglycerate mutase [Faunimonas pinastri]|uniref:Probable phosphoglycerate mutase n=1 Tax=Faunimonas pinastri TaxID=1855383 RepID=A0A1H9FKN2_9HYPH|nr:histidine phosphatase family protein [Faunimonas pinastri]SEQ38365.1 probable phosphoglycerate mutase [Faunimonas pinastri]
MTTILLVRHATHDRLSRMLVGRMPGVGLSGEGREQAGRTGAALSRESVRAVLTSPVQRAVETAGSIAVATGCPASVRDGLAEIDFGEWTGRSFAELEADPRWARWNEMRGEARVPGGESMAEVQGRIVAVIDAIQQEHADGNVVLVSHGDVIKAALAHYLGLSLDCILRFDVSPASISRIAVGPWGGRVLNINEVPG